MKLFKQVILRVIFLPLILAAGLVATAMFTIRVMFKPDDVKAIVTDQFQQIMKRPVQIEWARLSYTGEIKIKGLSVVEPGPEAVDFLKAEYIYATYRLPPLLHRKLEIDSVVLVSPSITLLKRGDGNWNVSDILAAYRQNGKGGLLESINTAEIKDGRLEVSLLKSGKHYNFDNLNATLSGFKPGTDTSFYASVFFKSNAFRKPVTGRLYAEGSVNLAGFDWEESRLKDLKADITLLDKTIRFTGDVKNLRRPELSLRAEVPSFRNTDLAYLFDSPFRFSAPQSAWEISSVFPSTASARVTVSVKPLDLKAEGDFDLSRSTLTYSFMISAPPVALDKLKGYGAVLPLDKPVGKAQVRLRLASRDGRPVFSRAFLNTAGAGFSYRKLNVSNLDLAALISDDIRNSYISTSRGRLVLGDNTLAGLKLDTEFLKDGFLLKYSGKFNGGPAKGRAVIRRPLTAERSVDFIGYSEDLLFSSLKKLVFDIRDLRGPRVGMPEFDSDLAWLKKLKNSIPIGYSSVKVLYKAGRFRHDYMNAEDFYLAGTLKDISGDISKIKGDISVKAGAGTFYDVQKTSEEDHVYYLFSLPLTFIHRMNRVGALKFDYKVKDVSFNSIGGDYSVDDGKVEIKNFYMEGKDFSAFVSGMLDFKNETMKVKIYTMSGKYSSMGSLPEALTDSSGKPALAFTLEGKMTAPEFKMISPKDSGRIIREAAQKGANIDFNRIDSFAGGK
ncbi:MAG: AsmA family protein [Elusimicrobia bacterium]|nr:AsmA family protein [Elusimicrobiota bacterium]